jgi:hypothetical protein
LIFPLSLAAFIPKKIFILIPAIIATIFALSIYVPYIYITDYAKGYTLITAEIEAVGLFAVVVFLLVYFLKARFFLKH